MLFTISLAQMNIQLGKPEENIKKAVSFVEDAARNSSHLILLPELWSSGYDLENAPLHAGATPEILSELLHLSHVHKLCIGGSLLEAAAEGLYNTFAWISPDLPQPIFYRKIHLFRLMAEEQWLRPGDQPVCVPTAWGTSGLSVCYDLRFPEIFRRYALDGARCVLLSAEWPVRRIAHWKTLLRARAIENQSFMVATNCVGASSKDQFGGSSTVISPWGEALIEGSQSGEEILHASIETDQIDQARGFMPVFQDRRPEVYGL